MRKRIFAVLGSASDRSLRSRPKSAVADFVEFGAMAEGQRNGPSLATA